MKRAKVWLFSVGAAIVIAVLGWGIYRLAEYSVQPDESPLNAVPDNTALIIKINKPGNLWEELNRSNLIWKSLSRYPVIRSIKNELHLFDSISRKNQNISAVLQRYNLVLTLTLSGHTRFGVVFLTSAPGLDPGKYADEFARELFGDSAKISETPYASTTIHRLQSGDKSTPFYYSTVKGVFIGSFLADLVKKSIDRLTFNTPAFQASGFHKVEVPSGKKADANIYVNYRMLALALSRISRTENHMALIQLARLASWSGLDVIIKKDELFLNGFTLADDTTFHYLNLFTGQVPQPNELISVAPEKVAYFAFFGWGDLTTYFERLELRNHQDELEAGNQNALSQMNQRYRINLSDFFLPWMGKQAMVFAMEADSGQGSDRVFAAFQVRDSILAVSLLDSLRVRMGIKKDSIRYKGYRITGIHFNHILQNLFGSLFEPAGHAWYTFINHALVFGQDPSALKFLIDENITGYTLGRNKDYLDFSGKMAGRSNIFIYFNTPYASKAISRMIDDPLLSTLHPMLDSLKKFQPVGIQYSSQEEFFSTSIFIGYTPNLRKEGPLNWKAKLDTTITGSPQILNTMAKSDPVILVRDTLNNIYQYGANGLLRWRLHVMGKILSKVKAVIMPYCDTVFYFFNTDSHLYLLRSDGQSARDYPMRFPIPATNALTIVNFDHKADYRIFVAFNDKRIYQFDLKGHSVANWERPLMKAAIRNPVEYIVSNHKDFFFIRDLENNLIITDRQGRQRIRVGPMFRPADHSTFYPVNMAQKGIFVTTGPGGKLIFIQENGKTIEISLGQFSPRHWFFNENVMGNIVPEYIFVDKNKISYYSRSNKLIYSYVFRREISRAPFVLYDGLNRISLIGVTIPETGELFLFDSKGYYPMEPGVYGNTAFDIGHMDSEESFNLVVGSGSYLRNYLIPSR
ncbi:MAG: hypothetical protein NTW31_00730 [Bacteroidetes bacterium]|nr:hypothetical protein [Bacteroidota bacterium]